MRPSSPVGQVSPLALLGFVLAAGCASPDAVGRRDSQRAPSAAPQLAARQPELVLSPGRPPPDFSRPTIEFFEFYRYGTRRPAPRPRLLELHGKRVTLVGYMAQMRSPPRGGFYLAPYPAVSDGTGPRGGGLPPPSVLVLPLAARGRQVAFVGGALEVTGILDVGTREGAARDGGAVRLILDDPKGLKLANTTSRDRAATRRQGDGSARRQIAAR